MEPISSIPRSQSFGDLYGVCNDRENESFFVTQEEQAEIIQQMMDAGKGRQGTEPK